MSPHPSSDEGSGPVDGEQIELKLTPHHQLHRPKKGFPLAKTLFTGTAIVGGIVGLYFLYKHFFGKKKKQQKAANGNNGGNNGNGNGRNRRRDVRWEGGVQVGEVMKGVYEEALLDEGFMEFMESVYEGGFLEFEKTVEE